MIVTGNIYRKILKENKFSAKFDVSFSSVTGSSEIGFSGNSKKYKFSFISGKIFDDESRYFSSYLPNDQLIIETNFSGTAYDYSIDGSRILKSGTKENFYAERFYINTTGSNVDASIQIKSQKPTLSLFFPNSFTTGSYLTGYLITNSASGFQLFSGYFNPDSAFSFSTPPTGFISSTSGLKLSISESSLTLGDFSPQVFFDTSAGNYSLNFSASKIETPYINYEFKIFEELNTLENLTLSSLNAPIFKVGNLMLNYGYSTNDYSLIPNSLPLDISLSYYSGYTGYYGFVTGVQVNSGGNGYLSAPTITFSGGSGNSALAEARLGRSTFNYSSVANVEMTSFGSGYVSTPIVSFSGGTGILNNTLPTIASGSGLTTFYTKKFTGSFDLLTGLDSNLVSYLSNSYLSGSKYIKTGHSISQNSLINIQVKYNTSFDNDFMVAKLVISGINNNIIEKYVTGIK